MSSPVPRVDARSGSLRPSTRRSPLACAISTTAVPPGSIAHSASTGSPSGPVTSGVAAGASERREQRVEGALAAVGERELARPARTPARRMPGGHGGGGVRRARACRGTCRGRRRQLTRERWASSTRLTRIRGRVVLDASDATRPTIPSGSRRHIVLERVPLLERQLADYAGVVGIDVVDADRRAGGSAEGRPGAAPQRNRVRRRRRRAARHPRAAAAQRRDRRRLAGDARQRRVLRGDEDGPQRAAGCRPRLDAPHAAHLPREGARQRSPLRRPLRLRRRPRSAAGRHAELPARAPGWPDAGHQVDLALPHRPHRRQPEGLGVLPPVRGAARRVGVDDARVRARVARRWTASSPRRRASTRCR